MLDGTRGEWENENEERDYSGMEKHETCHRNSPFVNLSPSLPVFSFSHPLARSLAQLLVPTLLMSADAL